MQPGERWKRAIRRAGMPRSAVVVFDTIVDSGDYATARLPDKYQPRSLRELARWAGVPKSTLAVNLNLLEQFGWLVRARPGELRRGLSTTYQPREGRTRSELRRPLTDAERMRRYRARKRGSQASDLGERYDELDRNSVTQKLDQSTVQVVVTNPHVNGQIAQEALRGSGVDPADFKISKRNDPLWWGSVAEGPCVLCSALCVRYGESGGPLCSDCRHAGLA